MRKVIGVLALALLLVGLWIGTPPFRAWRAAASPCDDGLLANAPGAWVRLRGCAVDMFHNAALVDEAGVQSRLVMPLRRSGDSAAEPSALALVAMPELLVDPSTHRRSIRPDSTQTADIAESLVVVLGPAEDGRFKLTTFPQIEPGLAPNPLLLELRKEPSPRPAGLLLAAALLLGTLAAANRRRDAAERDRIRGGTDRELAARRETAAAAGARRPIRWGLVFVSVLVGLVALARALQWSLDPVRSGNWTSAAARPQPPATAQAKAALVPPSPEELAGLESDDLEVQRVAVERLAEREITPDVIRAVDRALARGPRSKEMEAALVCARTRGTADGSLAYLLDRFPTDPFDIRETRSPGVACVAAALAARIDEDPRQIRDALKRAFFSDNQDAIREAAKGFRRLAPTPIPSDLAAEATTETALHQRAALRAVAAMGAIRSDPRLVLRAARIDASAHVTPIREDLVEEPHPNGARILARLCVEGGGQFCRLLREREAIHHDSSAALLEVASDPAEPFLHRREAVEQLRGLREWGVLPGLRRLRDIPGGGELAPHVAAAIAEIEALERPDRPARMRELGPRGLEW